LLVAATERRACTRGPGVTVLWCTNQRLAFQDAVDGLEVDTEAFSEPEQGVRACGRRRSGGA